MKKLIALFIVFSIIGPSANLYSKERHGANVEIHITKPTSTMEGTPWEETAVPEIKGELIAVKQKSLLLKDSHSGADVSVEVKDIRVIKIVKESKTGVGVGLGFFAGAFLGAMVGLAVDEVISKTEITWGPQKSALLGGALGGIVGGISGGIIGANRYDTIQIEDKSDIEIKAILEELRKKARVPDYQ